MTRKNLPREVITRFKLKAETMASKPHGYDVIQGIKDGHKPPTGFYQYREGLYEGMIEAYLECVNEL